MSGSDAFLDRPIEANRRICGSMPPTSRSATAAASSPVAAIIAVAVNTEGRREIVGLGLGPSEAEPFWSAL